MNILYINNYNLGGGAETVFSLIRDNQQKHNVYSGFVSNDNESKKKSDILFTSWQTKNRIWGVINYIFSVNNYKSLLSFLKKKPIQVIHLHGFFSSLSPSILFAIKKFKKNNHHVKIIQTLHDYHLVCPNSSLYNYKKNLLCEKCVGSKYKLHIFKDQCDRRGFLFSVIKGIRSLLANLLFRQVELVDVFISPSEFLKGKLLADGVPPQKIKVIRNPMLAEVTNDDCSKDNIICYFGRFSKEKNLDFLIRAFASWKSETKNEYSLLLIGDGPEKDHLVSLAKNNRHNEYILFKDFMRSNDLTKELRKVKYFSLTSSCFENAPMSIFEAAMQKVIPIVANIGGMRETIEIVLKAGKTYQAGNLQSWVETMIELDKNYIVELTTLTQSSNKIQQRFGLKSFLSELDDVYS